VRTDETTVDTLSRGPSQVGGDGGRLLSRQNVTVVPYSAPGLIVKHQSESREVGAWRT